MEIGGRVTPSFFWTGVRYPAKSVAVINERKHPSETLHDAWWNMQQLMPYRPGRNSMMRRKMRSWKETLERNSNIDQILWRNGETEATSTLFTSRDPRHWSRVIDPEAWRTNKWFHENNQVLNNIDNWENKVLVVAIKSQEIRPTLVFNDILRKVEKVFNRVNGDFWREGLNIGRETFVAKRGSYGCVRITFYPLGNTKTYTLHKMDGRWYSKIQNDLRSANEDAALYDLSRDFDVERSYIFKVEFLFLNLKVQNGTISSSNTAEKRRRKRRKGNNNNAIPLRRRGVRGGKIIRGKFPPRRGRGHIINDEDRRKLKNFGGKNIFVPCEKMDGLCLYQCFVQRFKLDTSARHLREDMIKIYGCETDFKSGSEKAMLMLCKKFGKGLRLFDVNGKILKEVGFTEIEPVNMINLLWVPAHYCLVKSPLILFSKHICGKCGKVFGEKTGLIRHAKKNCLQCKKCKLVCENSNDLEIHKKEHGKKSKRGFLEKPKEPARCADVIFLDIETISPINKGFDGLLKYQKPFQIGWMKQSDYGETKEMRDKVYISKGRDCWGGFLKFLEDFYKELLEREGEPIKDNKWCVPIISHNGGKFDIILMLEELTRLRKSFTCLKNSGSYIQVGYMDVYKFRDSLRFLKGSLEYLAKYYLKECGGQQKEIFPYQFVDSWKKTTYIGPKPPKKFFKKTVVIPGPLKANKKIEITDEEYAEIPDTYDVDKICEEYLKSDVVALCQIWEKFREGWQKLGCDPNNFMTVSQMSHHLFLSKYMKEKTIPKLQKEEDQFIRRGLFGGRTEVFQRWLSETEKRELANKEKEILYYDVNSLYPAVMSKYPLPCGTPEWKEFNGKLEDCFGFLEVDVECPTSLFLPVLPEKKDMGNSVKNMFDLTPKTKAVYFSEELKLAVKKGYKITKVYSYLEFEKGMVYKEFIDEMKKQKIEGELTGNKPQRQASKDAQNSSFGKTIQNINSDVKVLYSKKQLKKLLEDGKKEIKIFPLDSFPDEKLGKIMTQEKLGLKRKRLKENQDSVIYKSMSPEAWRQQIRTKIDNQDLLELPLECEIKDLDPEPGNKTCSALGAAILSLARIELYKWFERISEKGGNHLYADTDSVVYIGKKRLDDFHVHDTEYGKMKIEIDPQQIIDFVAVSPKLYGFKLKNGDPYIKCKGMRFGMNDSILNFNAMLDVAQNNASYKVNTFEMRRNRSKQIAAIENIKFLRDSFDKRICIEGGKTIPFI